MTTSSTKKKVILLIDDDEEWRTSLAASLDDRYVVKCASDGEEGLRLARVLKPAAVVLDVMMPGGRDGLVVFCELRKDPETWHIPVVVLSSVNQTSGLGIKMEDLRRYLGCVPEAFIEKPAKMDVLRQELQRLVDERGEASGVSTRGMPRTPSVSSKGAPATP